MSTSDVTVSTAPPEADAPPASRSTALIAAAVVALTLVGLGVRLYATRILLPHIDEPASVMAAWMVVEKGVPIYPSGVLYLQGATLSYLLAPLVAMGRGGLEDLQRMRVLVAATGSLAIPLAGMLGERLTGRRLAGLFVAACVAFDPQSVEWSAHVRPYAVEQPLALAMMVMFADALATRMTAGRVAAFVGLFVVGMFTSATTGLLWPAMALVALGWFGRSLLRDRRDVAVAMIGALAGPLLFLAVNALFGVSSRGADAHAGFVGDHLLDPETILAPNLWAWYDLFHGSDERQLMIPLTTAVTGLLLGRKLLDPTASRRAETLATVTLFYVPVAVIAGFTVESQARYLLLVHALTWVLVAMAAIELFPAPSGGGWRRFLPEGPYPVPRAILAVAALGVTISAIVTGLDWRLSIVMVDPDYRPALAWIRQFRGDDDGPVLVAMPPVAWLDFREHGASVDRLRFLAGPEGGVRATRYARRTADGQIVDYWAAVPVVGSIAALCDVLANEPDALLVVDDDRMHSKLSYAGPMAQVIKGATHPLFGKPTTAEVLEPLPKGQWSLEALQYCRAPDAALPAGFIGPELTTTGATTTPADDAADDDGTP